MKLIVYCNYIGEGESYIQVNNVACGVVVEGAVAGDIALKTLLCIRSDPITISATRVHAEVPILLSQLPCYFPQSTHFMVSYSTSNIYIYI